MWEKGRNWVTVVLEVICACVDRETQVEEDDDMLEIPIFVRLEYEADIEKDDGGGGGEKGGREKRELAYWAVIGVGRVARLHASAY